jgi:hypothetical protein
MEILQAQTNITEVYFDLTDGMSSLMILSYFEGEDRRLMRENFLRDFRWLPNQDLGTKTLGYKL